METKNSARLKTTILFIAVAVPLILNGQNSNPPKNDFNLSFSRDMLEPARGGSGQVDIMMNTIIGHKTKGSIVKLLIN